jgi:hypothetical protein
LYILAFQIRSGVLQKKNAVKKPLPRVETSAVKAAKPHHPRPSSSEEGSPVIPLLG